MSTRRAADLRTRKSLNADAGRQCSLARSVAGKYLSCTANRAWKKTFKRFLQTISVRNPRRLVLKSPPHTCRIKVLKVMFPDAHFIHIVRNPYVVYPSTVNMWKTMYQRQGMQTPTFAGLEEQIFETFTRMYAKLEETRHLVDDQHFHEMRYEDLVRDPIGAMRELLHA